FDGAMTFAECTATSIRPSSNASSSSFTKTPRVPISPNGLVRSRSPAVVIGTRAISTPGLRSCSAATPACVSASLLPRVPTRSSIVAEPEEVSNRVRVDRSVGPRGGLLHANGGEMKQLVHDLHGDRLDRHPLVLRQPAQHAARAIELGRPDFLRPGAKRRDRRDDLSG